MSEQAWPAVNGQGSSTDAVPLPYLDQGRSAEARAADLLSRMTIAEKAAQMRCVWQEKVGTLVGSDGEFDRRLALAAFGDGRGIGQVGRPSDAGSTPLTPERGRNARQMAELTNAIQEFFLTHSRLGIPVVFHEECLHGLAAVEATSFPQPIALAATCNPELVERLYRMTAREARLRGTHQALTPVVDVARDPRWGRVEETFGEDTWLATQMGIAAVRGFQGDGSFTDKRHVIATLKHFAAHGQPESGMNCAPVNVSERVLRETFLRPFKDALQAGGAISVMASYNEIDGVPSHANRWLLHDVLRQEWGFRGYVVSDYYAVWELSHRPDTHGHHVAADKREACLLAVRAGVNIELPDPDCYLHLESLVQEGALTEADLDAMVGPMLFWKFKLGLFDDPYVDPAEAERVVGCEAHRDLAREGAAEAITLLRNTSNVLPLDASVLHTIAVVGPNAHRPLLGGYSGVPRHASTVLEGIRAHVGDAVRVVHAEGCGITQPGSWNQDEVLPADPQRDRALIDEAVTLVRDADVIILALGGNEQTSREAWNRHHMGDRTSLDLIGRQEELARAMIATGKPVIVLLFNGRPLSVNYLAQEAHALLECWYLGQETGAAVADVLFGAVNPAGKLPITVPRSAGHLPAFYNYKPSARRGYLFDDVSPLYAFGFGLSYTTFAVRNVRLDSDRIARDGSTTVSADVTNIGTRAGCEVVQLYIRDVVSSVTRPIKELRGMQKVRLAPGETVTASFVVTPEALAFHDVHMQWVVEPGEFAIMVGTSSRDEDLQRVTLHVHT